MLINHIATSAQIHFLKPLEKWRIMSLEDLMQDCLYPGTYESFAKKIYRLEKGKKLIESYIDPYTKKKYVYLSKKGATYVCDEKNHLAPSSHSIIHDTKVSMLTREFLKLEVFKRYYLEHEYKNNLFKERARADAALVANLIGKETRFALELELTRKSKIRIKNKVLEHLSNNSFDYILYYFQDKSLMKTYQKVIEEAYKDKASQRVIYAYNPKLMLKDFKFQDTLIFTKGKVREITTFFGLPD